MSLNFRPVIEKWGPSASCLRGTYATEVILELLSKAADPGGKVQTTEYDDVLVTWIENGTRFLDYIDSTNADLLITVTNMNATLSEKEDVLNVLEEMKRMSLEWRSFVDDTDGSLRFYID